MVMEAEEIPPEGRTRREYHRHIGDFTLFWTGLFPEAVKRQDAGWAKDSFISYTLQGKQAAVLKRLGTEFELCAFGLNRVRKELDELNGDGESARLLGG
jgi:hypothetical protein